MFKKVLPYALCIVLGASCTKNDNDDITVAQETYAIPGNQFFPEGIAYNSQTGLFYTGSVNNGDIVQVNVETGAASVISTGSSQNRAAATGMKIDNNNRLWVCGGADNKIQVLNLDGSLIKSWNTQTLFSSGFVNDCAVDDEYIYFTDSQVKKIYRASVSGAQPGDPEAWLTFTDAQIPYALTGINANGIVLTGDDKYVIIVISSSGKLYRIDRSTKAISEIALNSAVTSGDGLWLEGTTLYVSRNQTGQIYPVALTADFSSGTVGTPFGSGLLFNTTMAKAGMYFLVVNGQLNRRPSATNPAPQAPVLPFSVSRVAIP